MITREYTAAGDYSDYSSGSGSMSWSHTSSGGSDCVVLIGIGFDPDLATTTSKRVNNTAVVTYGGSPAMFVGFCDLGVNNSYGGTAWWYAIWNPPTGAQTVSVTVTTASSYGHTLHGTSVSYRGVRSIHRVDSIGGTGSTTGTITVQSATGRKLVHIGSTSATTVSSYSQNQLYVETTNQAVVIGDADGASSVTFSWSRGSSGSYGSVVVELVPLEESGIIGLCSIGEGARSTGSSSSLGTSWTHQTNSGGAGYIVAIVGVVISVSSNSSDTTCSVTYGGEAMSQIALVLNGSSTSRSAVGIYQLASPPTGNVTVSVTTGGASTKAGVSGMSVIYDNVRYYADSGSIANMSLSISNVIPGMRAISVTGNNSSITSQTASDTFELYRDDGGSISGVGDHISMLDTVGNSGGSVALSNNGSSSSPIAQTIVLYPNIYGGNFLQLL